MTYDIKCTSCKSEGYFIFQGRLESCHKCKGWGVLEETAEFSVFDCGVFVDLFETNEDAINALVDCSKGEIRTTYTQCEWNYQWNFGRSLV